MKNLYTAILCVLVISVIPTNSQAGITKAFRSDDSIARFSPGTSEIIARATPLNDIYASPDSLLSAAGSLKFKDQILAAPGNDNLANAFDISGLINSSCTSGAAYTTLGATADQSKGTCWSNGPNNNVWFKFTATATGFINVQVKVSGAGETLRNPFVAIFDASLTQVACQNYQGSATDLSLSNLGLIPGNTYYIAVDNYSGYAGSFDLCLTDVPDYDYPIGAKDVNSLINSSCTSGGIYTTQFATPDDAKGTCWSNGPNNNRWFKFTATATGFINVQVKVSGAGETLRNPFVAIFDASLTQVACQNYQGSATDLSLSNLGLIPGNTYYIAVDNYSGYAGSFDLCLTDVPDYDYPIGAKDVNSLINSSCTSGGIYTTQFATPDDAKGTCWSNGPNNNRWFKFTATATGFINVQVKVSGAGETLRNPFVAIFDASLTQVACQNYQGSATDLSLSNLGLIPGNTYYIAVDNYSGYAGSFDLCLTDVPDYDYPIGAKDVNSLINSSCTSGGIYTTQFATPDDAKGTCWSNGPNNNRWFKFTATATGFINVQVKVSGAGETLRNPFVAIFDASLTQVACQNYQGSATDLSLSNLGLIPGNTYYIAVDNYSGYAGSFDLCLTDVPDYDYPIGAKDVNSLINSSCTSGGIYTTQFATPDDAKGTCWSNGPNNNRWFKFTATATGFINVQVKVSGAGETLRNPFVAIFDASLTQVACQNYQGSAVDECLGVSNLVAGNTYYIAVDNYSGYAGSFDLCLSDVSPAGISYPGSPYCASGTASVTQTGQAGGAYSSTAGLSINAATGTINLAASAAGSYTVKYTLTIGNCTNTTTALVTIKALPTAAISYAGGPFCATGTATVTQTGQSSGTYASTAGLSIDATTGAINLAASTAGIYTVTYNFTNGTCSNSTTTSVTVKALPTATISYAGSPYCATGTATVTRTGQAGGTYSSTSGLIIAAATGAINLATSTPGTYAVTYSFSNGTCNNTATASVTISTAPTATISYSGSPYCATGTAAVTQTGQGGGTYSSTVGLNITAATGAINLATSTPGTYTVTYSFSNGTCSNTTTASVIIKALPVATISYSGSPYCATGIATVTQTGQAGGIYSSTAGLSITAATGAVNLTTSTAGTYTVTYAFSNGSCSNTTTASVTINALPTASISYSGNPYCAAGTAAVTQTGQSGGIYSSTAGLSISAATGAIDLTSSTPGAYTVTYSFNNGICNNNTSTLVNISLPPQVVITNPAAVCSPNTVDITSAAVTSGSTAGLLYTYFNDALATSTLPAPNAVALNGTYYIRGTAASGCSDIQPVVVTINPKPSVIITNPAAVCFGSTVDITSAAITAGSTTGLVYSYFKDAGATTVLPNPNAISAGGTYYIQGNDASGCSDIQPVQATINPLPTASISYNGSPYCSQGFAYVSLTGQAGGTFVSTPGLSINSSTGDINLATSSEGTYAVVYSFTNGTCGNSVITSVTIKNPNIQVNDPPGVCFPGTVNLLDPAITAGSESGLYFNFYQDAAGLVALPNPFAVGTNGTYYIMGTSSSTGCESDVRPVNVTIFAKPSITAGSSETDICKGSTATLTASSPGNSIYWPGLGSGNSFTVTPVDSTRYLAIATTADGCEDTAIVDVAVNPFVINLKANPDPVLAGTSTTLTTDGNFTYNVLSWSPNIFFADQTALTQTIVVKDTSKSFTVIAKSDDGCLDTATLYVMVDPNLKDFFIPNSFSPNNDGNNDIFKVYGSSVREVILRVYNQWGEIISETHNAQGGWDGNWRGHPQAVGVYVYEAKVTFYNNVIIKRKGTVNLIR